MKKQLEVHADPVNSTARQQTFLCQIKSQKYVHSSKWKTFSNNIYQILTKWASSDYISWNLGKPSYSWKGKVTQTFNFIYLPIITRHFLISQRWESLDFKISYSSPWENPSRKTGLLSERILNDFHSNSSSTCTMYVFP